MCKQNDTCVGWAFGVAQIGCPRALKIELQRSGRACRREGFTEGTNYSLAVRFSEGDVTQLAEELGALEIARVIVRYRLLYGMGEFRRAFPELPLVFTALRPTSLSS